jgi:peptidyl-prolyl cis-trans isomerase D
MAGAGLVPNVVETDFGFHIIKVTEGKSNTKYKIATISRELQASESTRNAIYQKAETCTLVIFCKVQVPYLPL